MIPSGSPVDLHPSSTIGGFIPWHSGNYTPGTPVAHTHTWSDLPFTPFQPGTALTATTGAFSGGITAPSLTINTNGDSALFSTYKGANATGGNLWGGGGGQSSYGDSGNGTLGSFNTSYGIDALSFITQGYNNSAFALNALQKTTTGHDNKAAGNNAGFSNTTGSYNTYDGVRAGQSNQTGNCNTGDGYYSLYFNTASFNSGFGAYSCYKNTTGTNNFGGGYYALYNNTIGDKNTALGAYAFTDLNITVANTGSNTGVGFNTGRGIVTGINNTIIGANVTGLDAALSGNIILADGSGSIKARYDGSSWTFSSPISCDNSITAPSFIKSGGTSSQFLKADGSVDSSSYLNATGFSGAWGNPPTSGPLVTMGTASGATWLVGGTSNGTFRGGLQLLDQGTGLRLYTGTSYLEVGSTGVAHNGTALVKTGGELGTPSSGVLTNCSGTAANLIVGKAQNAYVPNTNIAIGNANGNGVTYASGFYYNAGLYVPSLITATGVITTSAPGASIVSYAATTAGRSIRLANSGGSLYAGVESSTAGSYFPGSQAYESVWYAPSNNSRFITPEATFTGVVSVAATAGNGARIRLQGNGADSDHGFHLLSATDGTAYVAQKENKSLIFTTNQVGRLTIYGNGSFDFCNNPVVGVGALTATSFTGAGTGLTGTASSLTAGAVAWTGVTGKPTTVSGYGITDILSQPLTGLTLSSADVIASDTIITGMGKLQGQMQSPMSAVRTNLGSPTVLDVALTPQQMNNKTKFHPIDKIVTEYTTDGTTWLPWTVSDTVKKNLVVGYEKVGSSAAITNGWTKARITLEATEYEHLNQLYMYASMNGHTMSMIIEKSITGADGTWVTVITESSKFAGWPTHISLRHPAIYWHPSHGTYYKYVRITFIPIWNATYPSNGISILHFDWFGGYPSVKPEIYSWDYDKNVTFPAALNATQFNGSGAGLTGTAPNLSVNYATTAGSAPASDVYAWAKASTKPIYSFSEISSGAISATTGNFSGVISSNNTISGTNLYASATSGNGLRLWGGNTNYSVYMSTTADATFGGGWDAANADYNMYFRMNGAKRGFAFQNSSAHAETGTFAHGTFAHIKPYGIGGMLILKDTSVAGKAYGYYFSNGVPYIVEIG